MTNWALSILPDAVVYAIAVIGVILIIASLFWQLLPFSRTSTPVLVTGILSAVIGVYLIGALNTEKHHRVAIMELESRNMAIESAIVKTDIVLVEKLVTRTNTIQKRGRDIVRYVDREVVKYDTRFVAGGECAMPDSFFKAYNDSLGVDR